MEQEDYLTSELLDKILRAPTLEALSLDEQDTQRSLSLYLDYVLKKYKLKKSKVIKDALINETHGYQIFSGNRRASRNKILALAFSMGLDLHETRLLLTHADVGDLYCKNRRDAIIIFCIEKRYSLTKTDCELHRFGEATISSES